MRTSTLLALLWISGCGSEKEVDTATDAPTPSTETTATTTETTTTTTSSTTTASTTTTSSTTTTTTVSDTELLDTGGVRRWADGTLSASCYDYLNPATGYAYAGDTGDGAYEIALVGGGTAVTYCDMTDGGWTLISQSVPVDDATANLCVVDGVGTLDADLTTVNAPAKLSDFDINGVWGAGDGQKKLRIYDDHATSATSRAAWQRSCELDFTAGYFFVATAHSADMAHLDSTTVTCSDTDFDVTGTQDHAAEWFCGYSFQNGSSFVTYAGGTSYSGGSCAPANAGRSWLGVGNYGCSVEKVFVR